MKWFKGQTVVVLASGPSLTAEDVLAVRHLPAVAVNSTWEVAPWCDVIFAGDNKWWMHNHDRITIDAVRASISYNAERQFGADHFNSKLKKGGYNSGCIAIEYAIRHGAKRVILLGFDCSVKHGIHHHGPHKHSPNPNAGKCQIWQRQFARLRSTYPDADVVNCSRYTELLYFPRAPLERVLANEER